MVNTVGLNKMAFWYREMLNFAKILKMMQAVDWLYLGEPVTLEAIKNTADLVVHKAHASKETVRTGGFMCVYPSMELFFIGDSCGTL